MVGILRHKYDAECCFGFSFVLAVYPVAGMNFVVGFFRFDSPQEHEAHEENMTTIGTWEKTYEKENPLLDQLVFILDAGGRDFRRKRPGG